MKKKQHKLFLKVEFVKNSTLENKFSNLPNLTILTENNFDEIDKKKSG